MGENQSDQALPALVQCKKCGMPLCQSCCTKLETVTTENTPNDSETEKRLVPHLHTSECQILQNAGYKNVQIKNFKAVRQLYSILSPLRLLLESKKNPRLLDLEVITTVI